MVLVFSKKTKKDPILHFTTDTEIFAHILDMK